MSETEYREAGVLIDLDVNPDGKPIYWHTPAGRSSVYIPDSRTLWDLIWEHRHKRMGFAHTHPGSGFPSPSLDPDLTTFRAIQQGIGKEMIWWIASSNTLVKVRLCNFPSLEYGAIRVRELPDWFEELQRLSHSEEDSPCP